MRLKTYLKKGYLSMDENGYVDIISISEIPEDEQCRTWVCYDAYGHLDTRGVDAWDYVRIMRITGLCYQCGYISSRSASTSVCRLRRDCRRNMEALRRFLKATSMDINSENDSDDDRSYFTGGRREKPSKIFSRSTIQSRRSIRTRSSM